MRYETAIIAIYHSRFYTDLYHSLEVKGHNFCPRHTVAEMSVSDPAGDVIRTRAKISLPLLHNRKKAIRLDALTTELTGKLYERDNFMSIYNRISY